MRRPSDIDASRRQFLRFLTTSPLFASLGLPTWPIEGSGRTESPKEVEDLITSPAEAINVFDFKMVAQKVLPPAHYAYLATGVDGDATVRANREAFSKIKVRAHRLVDVGKIDMSTEIFGERWETPIVLAPVGSQKAFHEEGEVAVARAAKSRQNLQILSTVTTASVEEVTEARGAPVWYQLYPTPVWSNGKELVKRAEAAGCPALVLTVDLTVTSNRETLKRLAKTDARDCSVCHREGFEAYVERKPMFDGLNVSGVDTVLNPNMTWDFVDRLRDLTRMKMILKGIVTREDAALSLEHGVDGIVVSNHGGRAEASGRAAIDCLPEVIEAVEGRIPVLVDGGFRRGTDIFKALALGARAVAIGRPYLWGLASFGQAGVERVLDILRAELEVSMKLFGTPSVKEITPSFVIG